MNVVITGAAGTLGRVLTLAFSDHHAVSPSDIRMAPGPRMIVRANVLSTEDAACLTEDVEVVIHLAQAAWNPELSDADNETRILDTRLKGTYNVIEAAVKAGVRRVIQVSDLCLFNGYDDSIIVSEDFVPLPDTSAYQQSVYLSELIGREFAREHPDLVVTLRLGDLVDQDTLSTEKPLNDAWLDFRDAVAAVEKAMTLEHFDGLGHWGLYNLAADRPGSRFSLLKATSGQFGFRPAFNFEAWWKEERA